MTVSCFLAHFENNFGQNYVKEMLITIRELFWRDYLTHSDLDITPFGSNA